MIGYLTDWGYCERKMSGDPTTFNIKLSDITITDKSRYWCFPVGGENLPEAIVRKRYDETWSIIKSWIGDDIYLFSSYKNIYQKPEPIETNWVYGMTLRFPSLNNTYPNNATLYIPTSEIPTGIANEIIIFKTLNKVLWFNSINSLFLFDIKGDDLIYRNVAQYTYWAYDGARLTYIGGPKNLTSSWALFQLKFYSSWNFPNEEWNVTFNRISPTSAIWPRVLSFLFEDSSRPPDIEGGTVPPTNPYEPGGPSEEGGGDGSFDDKSDPIPDSTPPTISSSNTGFTRIYNPSLSQVQDLAKYLWTDETVIQTIWNHIKQYFEDPMQAIIGFNLVPCVVPNGGTKNFALMYIDTGVQMTVAANQFVDVDCGTLELEEYYGSALDYSPYTKVSCFLPYIGTVQLNTDEVMKTTLHVKYRIDICSGSCVAKILVNGSVLYQYSGHCAIPIPFSAADFSSYVSAAISVAKLAVGAAAGGAMGALASADIDPAQQTNQVITTTQVTNTARNPATGRQITTGTQTRVETRESPADQSSTQASFSGLTPANISNTVGQIMGSKPHVEHSGSFSGNTGYLGVRRPFLIIERPNMCMPSQYQQFNGFPSMITETLSLLKGFTKVQQVQLTGMSATNPEQAEILEFLKSGVVL